MFEWLKALFTPSSPPQPIKTATHVSVSKPRLSQKDLTFPGTKFLNSDTFFVNTLNCENNFFIYSHFSENREWLIGSCPSSHNDGKFRKGAFVVLNKESGVKFHKQLTNPYKGFISNNGTCTIIDNLNPSELQRRGVFYIFSPAGEVIIKKRFNDSNISCFDITPKATFSFCQTHNDDLYIYDIKKQRQCRHIQDAIRLYHHNQNFHFDIENHRLVAFFGDLEYRYHFQGGLYADGDSYLKDALKMQKTDSPDLNRILFLLLCANANVVSPSKEIKLQKTLGETYYQLNDIKKAKIHLESALKDSPRCGAKHLLDKITSEEN